MVLLIVLLILTMTTATATFAMHNTGYEIQAAGGIFSAMRARNVADGHAVAAMVQLDEDVTPCENRKNLLLSGGGAWVAPPVEQFGYPTIDPSSAQAVGTVVGADLINFAATPTPTDFDITQDPRARPWEADSWALVECREVNPPAGNMAGGATAQYRLTATVFGMRSLQGDSTTAGRQDHESISISRFYNSHPE
jgi:hypothetical protein